MNYTLTQLGIRHVQNMTLEQSARFKHYMRNMQKEGNVKKGAIENLKSIGFCNQNGDLSPMYFEVLK